MNKFKNILIIATGGTVAGVGDVNKVCTYKSACMDINKVVGIADNIMSIKQLANIETEQFVNVDSCDLTFFDWINLAKLINKKSKEERYDGFVITHGTDTMEETAYFLNLTLKTHKPVVLTGSMRPPEAVSSDAAFNIYQAVALARCDESHGKGVMLAFSDGIFGARDVQKVNTYRTNAFDQKDFGSLGYIYEDKVYFHNYSTKKHTLDVEFDVEDLKTLPKVETIHFQVNADVNLLSFAAENSAGIVIAGAGNGNCSNEWNKKIEEFMSKKIPVVRCSRISNGLVKGENNFEKHGIYANTLASQKARILLSLALTTTKNISKIAEMFDKY